MAGGGAESKESAPVFLLTHPRSRSTAFERMFLTRPDCVHCVHEIFQFPFHVGPERLNTRCIDDLKAGLESGHDRATYKWAFDEIERIGQPDQDGSIKRVFVKDMGRMFVPVGQQPAAPVPSLAPFSNSEDEITHNPTCVPLEFLRRFHFTFLIRHPRSSIPSLYRLSRPPLAELTGWQGWRDHEDGYLELRKIFDYLRDIGEIGPAIATNEDARRKATDETYEQSKAVNICVVDSDDLERSPHEIMELYCREVGVQYRPDMLSWGSMDDRARATEYFRHCKGFHLDLMKSDGFRARTLKNTEDETEEGLYERWRTEFGDEGAATIQRTVAASLPHYLHMKEFCMRIR